MSEQTLLYSYFGLGFGVVVLAETMAMVAGRSRTSRALSHLPPLTGFNAVWGPASP